MIFVTKEMFDFGMVTFLKLIIILEHFHAKFELVPVPDCSFEIVFFEVLVLLFPGALVLDRPHPDALEWSV